MAVSLQNLSLPLYAHDYGCFFGETMLISIVFRLESIAR